MKIEWLLSGTYPSWKEGIYPDGGYVYENYVRQVLREICEIDVTYLCRGSNESKFIRAFQFGNYVLKNMTLKFKGDVIIRDIFSTAFAPFDRTKKNIIVLHHLDISGVKYKGFYRLVKRRFFNRASLADKVVVVSEYWKRKLEKASHPDVTVIYNSFDLGRFRIPQRELKDFQERLGIEKGKPIIYLGNAREDKGYIESYEALKDVDAAFVITGKSKVNLPVYQFYLPYSDYIKLLKLSSVVITMSKFNEGWCRTAHEAMLCGTPVIGSGRGGMGELLKKGGQIICENFSELKDILEKLLDNQEKLRDIAVKGKEFAAQFSLDYFREAWVRLILTLVKSDSQAIT